MSEISDHERIAQWAEGYGTQTPVKEIFNDIAALIRRLGKERDKAIELAADLLPDRVIECHGDKCRYAWCASCNGDEHAIEALRELKARFATIKTTGSPHTPPHTQDVAKASD